MSLLIVGSVVGIGAIVLIPVFKVLANIAPYSYTNARIRAMLPSLVQDEQFANLAARQYNDVVYALEKSTYPELSKYTGADFSFASVDTAVRASFVDEMLKIRRISPQQSRAFLSAVISSADVQMIQSIVRSQKAQVNAKYDILHATEVFSKVFVTKDSITLEDLRDELRGTMYEDVFAKHFDELKRNKYDAFEHELDLLLYRRMLHAARGADARGFVKRLIDVQNVSLALQHIPPMIPGGRIPLDAYSDRPTVAQLVQILQQHEYHVTADSAKKLEHALRLDLKRFAKALLSKNPLSEASIVGYVMLKWLNIKNTSILLKMKYHDFDAKRIMEVLAV